MDMVKRFVEIEVDDDGERIKLDVDEKTGCLTQNQPQSNNFKMFQGKKISHEKEIMNKHFGRYPTIYVDFSIVQPKNFEKALSQLRVALHEAFRQHKYLRDNKFWDKRGSDKITFMKYYGSEESKLLTETEIESGLVFLSEVLYDYYEKKKVFVFIEEFDVPVNSLVYNDKISLGDKEQTIKLLRLIVKRVLKGSERTVERSLSNACHHLAGILSDSANNVKVSRFLQKKSFAEFYGFEETEVKSLLEKAGLTEYFADVKKKYDGYTAKSTCGEDIQIYSPWAILIYIEDKKLHNYWAARVPEVIKKQIGHFKDVR
ncbi:hypothetical protein PV325_013948 [Microctonus aethiopoides]|nr:hypothetical protein PV325_013948 [Microctonus aethiopoides]